MHNKKNKSSVDKSKIVKIIDPSEDQINSLINLYKSGQLSKTEKECRELHKKFQQSLIVINILGATLQRQGKLKEAVYSYEKAIQIKPDSADAYNNKSTALLALGKLNEAVESCKIAIQIRPDYAEAFYNLGNTLQELGQLNEAVESYQKAIQIRSNYVDALNNCGNALLELGQLNEALVSYEKAIQIKPDYADAYNNRGTVLQKLNRIEEAVASYKKAIQIKPDYAEAFFNNGIALQEKGQLNESIESYESAIKINNNYAEAYNNRGVALHELKKLGAATENFRKAISIDPENNLFWAAFSNCLQEIRFTSCNEALINDLLKILVHPTVNPDRISKAVISALQCYSRFKEIFEIYKSNITEKDLDDVALHFSSIPLFLKVMELSTIKDLDIEKMLLKIRTLMLTRAIKTKKEAQDLTFYIAMSMQCFCNEYIYFESEKEKKNIKLLQEEIKFSLEKGSIVSQTKIVVLAAYRPLSSFVWANDLLKVNWADDVKKIIVSQVDNIIKEKNLCSKISRLNIIDNKISQIVREQYEESPYPRWINPELSAKPKSIQEVLHSYNVHHNLDIQKLSDQPDILVAGCGTGHHAVSAASRFSKCNVLAVDLSLNSLSYAMRRTKELGFNNIEYIQGDILKLYKLEKQFDIIESSGVLHHMDNPLEGWKILVDRLRSGGVMKVGLYSDIARQYIVKAREYISNKKYIATQDGIRKFRNEIMNIESNPSSIISIISEFGDFYSLSSCRDLLFHVQEHRFTLPKIEQALDDLNLKFLGFQLSQHWIKRSFKNFYPDEDSLTSLSSWNQFELKNPNTFRGMYQFWVQKS